MSLSLMILALASTPISNPNEDSAIMVHDPVVRLGDLVDVQSVPASLRAAAARVDVVRLVVAGRAVNVPSDTIERRIRALVPALKGWAPGRLRPSYWVVYRPVGGKEVHEASLCLHARKTLESGSLLRSADFEEGSCESLSTGPWFAWNSQTRSAMARRVVREGETVPRFAGYGETQVYAGDRLAIQTQVGPVTVQRAVTALQSARPGERLLVRAEDGTILSGPMEARR